jgi:putative membrane protein
VATLAKVQGDFSVVHPIVSYLSYLLAGLALLAIFFTIYIRFTPYKEIALLKHGNRAVAYFLAGSMLGFSVTIAASIYTRASFPSFVAWSVGALVVQIIVYVGLNRVFSNLAKQIEENNAAVGILSGGTAFCAGLINAACLFS